MSGEKVLRDIATITGFMDQRGLEHGSYGPALLALENPDLDLRDGEIDVLVATRLEPDGDWNIGWIGGGAHRGLWLEAERMVIDPWLHERTLEALPEGSGSMMDMPIIYRSRSHAGPLDVSYRNAVEGRIDQVHQQAHADYLQWMEEGGSTTMVPTRARYLLTDDGVSKIAPHLPWAEVVRTLNHRGIPPTRTRAHQEARDAIAIEPSAGAAPPPPSERDRKARENKDAIARAMVDINRRPPLDWGKVLVAIAIGFAIAGAILYIS